MGLRRRVVKNGGSDPLIPLLDSHPVDGKYGDLYFNTTDNQIYRHSGKLWEVVLYGSLDPSIVKQRIREERLSYLLDEKSDKKID